MVAHIAEGLPALIALEPVQINMPVKMVAFMLDHPCHDTVPLKHYFIALKVGALGFCVLYQSPGTDRHPSSPYCSPDVPLITGLRI